MKAKKEKKTVKCVCENPGCGKVFTFKFFGGTLKKYCSEKCRCHAKKLAAMHGKEYRMDDVEARKFHMYHRENVARVRRYHARGRETQERIRQVELAKRLGLKTAWAVCKDCGERFEYVAEIVIGHSITEDLDMASAKRKPRTLEFCTKSCKNHFKWVHGGKMDYEKKKRNSSRRATLLVTRWRGERNFYHDRVNWKIVEDESRKDFHDSFDDTASEPIDLSKNLDSDTNE